MLRKIRTERNSFFVTGPGLGGAPILRKKERRKRKRRKK